MADNITLEQLKDLAERADERLDRLELNMSKGQDMTLAWNSWTNNSGDENFPYQYRLSVEGVTTISRADAVLDADSVVVASACGMCATCETTEGFVVFKSCTVPTADLTGKLYIKKQVTSKESAMVYGISRDITASSPVWTRTDAATGKNAVASVGTVAGYSDFDGCMPWSGIRRETLPTGDVMVKIPKFYFQRYREGDIEHIKIADGQKEGFAIHPLFKHGGVESEYAYVGAYKTSDNNKSVSGVAPQASQSRATMRTNAMAKGEGWGLVDMSALSAIQMLMLVEFATYNVQSVIGRGYTDGTAEVTVGSCDSVPNLTGRSSGTDGKTSVVYRGIEDFWGNIWEWIDGVNFNNGTYYICNDPSKYADDTATGYDALSFTGATNWNGSYITQEGLDNGNNAHIMLPSAAGSGSESTYVCDACWTGTGWKVLRNGGSWGNGSVSGLFAFLLSDDSSRTHETIGSRLLYIPQSA